jgi:putative membrane protein
MNRTALILKGMAMGMAEVIPGVSGGTIAFITGIYERLINAIKVVLNPGIIGTLRKEGLKAAWQKSDGTFLLFLIGGMVTGLVGGIFTITHLLETYPTLVWGFFFGLIAASIIYVGKQVKKWNWVTMLALIVGTVVAYYITIVNPGQGSESLPFVFLSGALAICALILPGISGSFILLLLGMYTIIIPTVKDALKTFQTESLIITGVFGLGCLVGLALFSRLLSWTFARYHDQTMAVLTGFMLGSLNKIWPWRNVLEYRTNSKGEEVPFIEENVLPAAYQGDALTAGVIVAFLLGLAAVYLLSRYEKTDEKN